MSESVNIRLLILSAHLKVLLGGKLLGFELALDVGEPQISEDATNLHPVLHVDLELFQGLKVLL